MAGILNASVAPELSTDEEEWQEFPQASLSSPTLPGKCVRAGLIALAPGVSLISGGGGLGECPACAALPCLGSSDATELG